MLSVEPFFSAKSGRWPFTFSQAKWTVTYRSVPAGSFISPSHQTTLINLLMQIVPHSTGFFFFSLFWVQRCKFFVINRWQPWEYQSQIYECFSFSALKLHHIHQLLLSLQVKTALLQRSNLSVMSIPIHQRPKVRYEMLIILCPNEHFIMQQKATQCATNAQ